MSDPYGNWNNANNRRTPCGHQNPWNANMPPSGYGCWGGGNRQYDPKRPLNRCGSSYNLHQAPCAHEQAPVHPNRQPAAAAQNNNLNYHNNNNPNNNHNNCNHGGKCCENAAAHNKCHGPSVPPPPPPPPLPYDPWNRNSDNQHHRHHDGCCKAHNCKNAAARPNAENCSRRVNASRSDGVRDDCPVHGRNRFQKESIKGHKSKADARQRHNKYPFMKTYVDEVVPPAKKFICEIPECRCACHYNDQSMVNAMPSQRRNGKRGGSKVKNFNYTEAGGTSSTKSNSERIACNQWHNRSDD